MYRKRKRNGDDKKELVTDIWKDVHELNIKKIETTILVNYRLN